MCLCIKGASRKHSLHSMDKAVRGPTGFLKKDSWILHGLILPQLQPTFSPLKGKYTWPTLKLYLITIIYVRLICFQVDFGYGIFPYRDNGLGRRFFINNVYPGCLNDVGWLVVKDADDICTWGKVPPYTAILYSPNINRINYNSPSKFSLPQNPVSEYNRLNK